MSTPIPPMSTTSSGPSGAALPPVAGEPLAAGPDGMQFIEMLIAGLGGKGAVPQQRQVGEPSTGELPLAGEEGKSLPPAMLSLPIPIPLYPTAPLPESGVGGSSSPMRPGVARIVPLSIPEVLQPDSVRAEKPESPSMPVRPSATEFALLQSVVPVRERGAAVASGVEVPELLPPALVAAQPQAAGPGSAPAASERPSLPISAPLHSPQWQGALGERLVWMVKRDLQQAELRLNPQHLGPVEVRIEIRNEQASITFSAHHTVTRDALEAAVPRLREMLGENGVNLASVDVSRHHGGSGQGQPRGGAREGGRQRDRSLLPEDVTQISTGHPDDGRFFRGGIGLVDLFA
ncbi:MAG TPA: hypothetical protein ENJ43_05665 [Gammaproteobacteria bacterium]|nr:hypothetical protein [Gammaproteobacteria bacterium]